MAATRTLPCSSATVSGSHEDRRAGLAGLGDALVDVGDLEGDVDDAVAVPGVVGDEVAVGRDGAAHDELDRAGLEHVGLVVAVAVLGAGVGDELHPPRRGVVVGGLGRVADHEADRVPPGHRERVGVGVVLHEADELAQLLEREVGLHLVHGQGATGRGDVSRHGANPAQLRQRVQQYVETSDKLHSRGALMDEIDGRLIELFATEPRLGVLEASRRLGIARGTVQARLDKLVAAGVITGWGPDLSPEAIGYPGDGVPDPRDPPGLGRPRRPRRRRRPPRRHPRGARGLHDHRRRRHVGPRRRPLQRRPPAGDRPGAHRARHRPLDDRHRAGHADPLPRACRWRGPRSAESPRPHDHGSVEVAWATSRPASSRQLRPARAPYAVRAGCTVPSQVSSPESTVTGRRNFTVRSTEV